MINSKDSKSSTSRKKSYVSKVYLQLYLLIFALEISKATTAGLSIIVNDTTNHILISMLQHSKMQNVAKQGPTLSLPWQSSFTTIRDFNCPFTFYKTFLDTKFLCNPHLYLLSIPTELFCTITPFFPNVNVSHLIFFPNVICYKVKCYNYFIKRLGKQQHWIRRGLCSQGRGARQCIYTCFSNKLQKSTKGMF